MHFCHCHANNCVQIPPIYPIFGLRSSKTFWNIVYLVIVDNDVNQDTPCNLSTVGQVAHIYEISKPDKVIDILNFRKFSTSPSLIIDNFIITDRNIPIVGYL